MDGRTQGEHDDGERCYLIGLVLHVGTKALRCAMEYPSRVLRDEAFEQLCAIVRTTTHEETEDD